MLARGPVAQAGAAEVDRSGGGTEELVVVGDVGVLVSAVVAVRGAAGTPDGAARPG